MAKVDFGSASGEDGQAVAIQTDGRILVVGRSGDDFAVARLSGGGTRNYAVQDANFNVTAVTDATGKVLERYQYDPYGSVTVLNADFSTDADGKQDVNMPFLWQGAALVTATGVYHFRHRDVDPRLGRPTQADPWRQDASAPTAGDGYPDGMNRYEWEKSNSQFYTDPEGLQAGPEFHHFYPLYLGGDINAPTFELNPTQHHDVHRYLAEQGLPKEDPGAARKQWRNMTPSERNKVIRESMKRAGFTDGMIRKHFANANKGNARMNRSPDRDKGKPKYTMDLKALNAARNRAKLLAGLKRAAAKYAPKILVGLSYFGYLQTANTAAKFLIAIFSDKFKMGFNPPEDGEDKSAFEMLRVALDPRIKARKPPQIYRSPEAALSKEGSPPYTLDRSYMGPNGRFKDFYRDSKGYRWTVPWRNRNGRFEYYEGYNRQPGE